MAANPLTVARLNPSAALQTGVSRHEMQEDSGGAQVEAKWILDEIGPVVGFGRGVSDPNITYVTFYNTNGTQVYAYPNAAGTGIIVTPTKP